MIGFDDFNLKFQLIWPGSLCMSSTSVAESLKQMQAMLLT